MTAAAMGARKLDEKRSLPFFGIPKLIPYIKKYRNMLLIMILCGCGGTLVDILLPLLQRYALNHFIGERTTDTLVPYIILYVLAIVFAAVMNYIACRGAMATEVRVNICRT